MKVAALVPVSFAQSDTLALHRLAGRPLLSHLCARLAGVERLAMILIVTSTDACDDRLESFCRSESLACHRGAEFDELGRVLAAMKAIDIKAAAIVRPNAPLIDPAIVDQVATLMEMTDGMVDYIGTDLSGTYPRGMEVEAFTRAALDDADRRCLDPEERAAAGLYLRRNSRLYRLLAVKAPDGLQRPDLRFDISDAADIPRLEALLPSQTLSPETAERPLLGLEDMIARLDATA